MENQNIPPFPFDALDGSFDGPEFDPADLFPLAPSQGAPGRQESLQAIRRKLLELDEQLRSILTLLDRELTSVPALAVASMGAAIGQEQRVAMTRPRTLDPLPSTLQREENVTRSIEGVFDGQNMVGPDGKQYSVPSNYSSKSKLVEGDILKLRITERGAFVYKQIGPIARERRVGVLERDDLTGDYVVIVPNEDGDRVDVQRAVVERCDLPVCEYRRFRILRASVTYYRGEAGDEVVLLVPKDAPSTWAAVENIIKR